MSNDNRINYHQRRGPWQMRAWRWKGRKYNCPNVIFGRSPLTILTQGVVPLGKWRPQFWRGVNNWGHPRCGTNTRSRGPLKTSSLHKTMSTGCQFERAGLERRANTHENLKIKHKNFINNLKSLALSFCTKNASILGDFAMTIFA